MITYSNIRFLNQPTRTIRQLVAVDVTLNGENYNWIVYTPLINGNSLNQYLEQISNIVQLDIEHKEQIWLNSPHTEIIENIDTGQPETVNIPKERVVHPTIPDYVELLSEIGYNIPERLNQVTNELPSNYWHYPQYVKRIIAPISLIMDDTGVKMYNWFQINSLPILKFGDNVELYCNVILPEHQTIVDSLQNVITVETRP